MLLKMVDPNFFHINKSFSISDIANLVNGKIVKSQNNNFDEKRTLISGVNSIQDATALEIAILSNIQYKIFLSQTKALVCIVDKDFNISPYPNVNFILVENAKYASALLSYSLYSVKTSSFDSNKPIHSNAKIGKNCSIGFNVVIEENVEIGDDCIIDHNSIIKYGVKIGSKAHIGSNVSISFAIIGDNVNILPGAKIGQEGFGFATYKNQHHKILHTGRVIIGNNVEIGANTTIDRGSNGQDTLLEDYVMIDNLVQIAHNVSVGRGSIMAAQVGIAGSSNIGKYCLFGGQSGVVGHLKIGDFVQVGGHSGVLQDVDTGAKVIGFPAFNSYSWHKQNIKLRKLSSLTI